MAITKGKKTIRIPADQNICKEFFFAILFVFENKNNICWNETPAHHISMSYMLSAGDKKTFATPSHALGIYVFGIVEYFEFPYPLYKYTIYISIICSFNLTEIRPVLQ